MTEYEYTRLFDGVKYLKLFNDNNLKTKSLEDNVYFTLRDIFINVSDFDNCIQSNVFNEKLTNNIYYEDRDDNFKYTNILNDDVYLYNLNKWLNNINETNFDFLEPSIDADEREKDLYYNVDLQNYIKFDSWIEQFNNLKKTISISYSNHYELSK